MVSGIESDFFVQYFHGAFRRRCTVYFIFGNIFIAHRVVQSRIRQFGTPTARSTIGDDQALQRPCECVFAHRSRSAAHAEHYKLVDYVERFLPYRIPIQFRYDYTETTPENLYEEDNDKILQDLKRLFTYKGLDGCRMRNGFHFEYKGLHMTYHKTLPYSTIEEKGADGVTYDILYDILIKQNGDIHSDWTGVKMDVDAYRRGVFEPYDLKVLNGTVDF